MSSDSGLPRSICPVIGGIAHGSIWPLDRSKLTIDDSDGSYYLQEVVVGGERFTAYRSDGLSDRDYKTMLRSWIVGHYEKKIEELTENKVEMA